MENGLLATGEGLTKMKKKCEGRYRYKIISLRDWEIRLRHCIKWRKNGIYGRGIELLAGGSAQNGYRVAQNAENMDRMDVEVLKMNGELGKMNKGLPKMQK
jgi:hypothetical protein